MRMRGHSQPSLGLWLTCRQLGSVPPWPSSASSFLDALAAKASVCGGGRVA